MGVAAGGNDVSMNASCRRRPDLGLDRRQALSVLRCIALLVKAPTVAPESMLLLNRCLPFEREDVGDDADFGGELEGKLSAAVVDELDEECREAFFRFCHASNLRRRSRFESGRCPGLA